MNDALTGLFSPSEWLTAIVENSNDAIISKDLNGIIQSWNRGAEIVFGYTAAEAIGKPVTMLMPPDRVNEEPGILARIRRGDMVDHYETVRRRKDGTLIDISLTVSPVRDAHGVIVGASKIARDITEHNRIAAAIREAEVMHRIVEVQEAERARIARDLHDHIGQQLTGVRLKIARLLDTIGDPEAVREQVDGIRDIATRMDRDVGFLSRELRPVELDHLGLVNSLANLVSEWGQQYGIDATFRAFPADAAVRPTGLTPEHEINLYRITQEGLNNILKHAQADSVSLFFYIGDENVRLVIEDNGVGFDVDTVGSSVPHHGFGLAGMRERTELLKGTFVIESEPGKGTSIVVRAPVHAKNVA